MTERNNVINFNDFRRKKKGLDKPIFKEPTTISIGDPTHPDQSGKYLIVCNLVHDGRQFLALERQDQKENQFLLVEGIVSDRLLEKVIPIEENELPQIEAKFKEVFQQASVKYGGRDHRKSKFNVRK